MRKSFLVLITIFFGLVCFSQNSSGKKKRVEKDSINNCEIVCDTTHIESKEINDPLFFYKAVLARTKNSYIKIEIKLDSFFSPIQSFLSKEIKESLKFNLPYYQVMVDGNYGYSSGYKLHYKGDRITIFRDCSCGFIRGQRVNGRRIRVINNYFFTKSSFLFLYYRNALVNDYDFKFKFDNGLPKSYVSYQDTNILDKSILFKNGKLDSVKSFHSNGELGYEASLVNGELYGYFIFYHPNGDEKLKVFFRENEIIHFINEEGRYDWDFITNNWRLN